MIRLSQHAAGQLARRGLLRGWIETAVSTPDWTAPDLDPTLTRSFKAIPEAGGKVLRVVHRPAGDDILIVTALFDRGARR
jgi:hypothetical protein